jgi:iron complex outermembrane recepter protein
LCDTTTLRVAVRAELARQPKATPPPTLPATKVSYYVNGRRRAESGGSLPSTRKRARRQIRHLKAIPMKFMSSTNKVVLLAVFWSIIHSRSLIGETNIEKNFGEADFYQLEPIIVTAEKRPSEAQNVPISITTFTSDIIRVSTIEQVPDLALLTPGLTIGNNSNTSVPEIFLRGVGTTDFSIGSDISIGFYFDDVYIGRGEAMFFELFDLERIEVLRGPQGTLYGRNTIGGAINIITNKPTHEFSASQQVKIGDFDLFNVNGTISGPIVHDRILGKLSYSYKDRDGYSENVFNGRELVDADNYSGRGKLWFFMSESVDLLLDIDFSKDRPTAVAYKPKLTGGSIFGGDLGNITLTNLGHVEPSDPFKVNQDTSINENREIFGVSGKLSWDMDELSLVSISAYRTLSFDSLNDVDGSSLQLIDFFSEFEQHQFSQEFRLSNKDHGPVQWITGAFLFFENSDGRNTTSFQDLSLFLGPGNYSGTNVTEAESRTYAVFGNGTVEMTERFSAIFGLRYSYEEKAFEIERISNDLAVLGDAGFPRTTDKDQWKAWTPKIGLQFQYTDKVMVYSTVSRGFKSGGYNAIQQEKQDSFDPEFITAFEVGVKSIWFERRLQLDTSAFYYDHTDLQVQTVVPSAAGTSLDVVTTNAAEASSIGVEIELHGRPTKALDITGGISVLHTGYKDFINADGIDVSDNDLKRSPELSTNVAIQYTFPIGDTWNISLRGEHQYQSKFFFTETNEGILSQEGFHNLNARVAFNTSNGRLSIAAFGKNLTDEETANVAFDFRDSLGAVLRTFNPPRTYGLEVACRF